MEVFQLDDNESRLARDVEAATPCEFVETDGQRPPIRAEVIRRLLLGLPVVLQPKQSGDVSTPRVVPVPGPGLRLTGAHIQGELDLDDGRSMSGGPLAPLVLTNCYIPDRLRLSRASIRHLSLANSQVTHVAADNIDIGGPLDISGVSTAELGEAKTGAQGHGLCWIDFRRAHVEGNLEAGRGAFVSPPSRTDHDDKARVSHYALQLGYAHIRDKVTLEPCVTAIGGIDMGNANIGGDVWARDIKLTSEESDAFYAQTTNIDGHLIIRSSHYLRRSVEIRGRLWLLGANIGSDLELINADINGDLVFSGAYVRNTFSVERLHVTRKNVVERPGTWADRLRRIASTGSSIFNFVFFKGDGPEVHLDRMKVGVFNDDGATGFGHNVSLNIGGFEFGKLIPGPRPASWSSTIFSFVRVIVNVAILNWLVMDPAIALANYIPKDANLGLGINSGLIVSLFVFVLACSIGYLAIQDLRITEPLWLARKKWLDAQYPARLSALNRTIYDPSPYEQFIRVFRAQGYFEDARKLASVKLTLDRKMKSFVLFRPVLWLYWLCFEYGLSPRRALVTLGLCIFIGWGGVIAADQGFPPAFIEKWDIGPWQIGPWHVPQLLSGKDIYARLPKSPSVMIVSTSVVNSFAVTDNSTRRVVVALGRSTWKDTVTGDMACGAQIEPLLFALDVFIPALDLRQESKCTISAEPQAYWWRIAKASYTVLGWIVVSLSILTISGILRRQAEA